MQKIRKDDEIIVIAGKDKGKTGTVTRIRDDGRVFVSGVNMIKRHTKGNPQMNQPGGIIEKEAPIQASNVAIYNRSADQADKVGIKTLEDGTKVRIYKSSGEQIDG
ncbi:MAG: 50S ribosomal protein L24 [Gammaproteobacteria bacterium]|jgi:large subunit ribosomal protein L24|nr:50S ribosomal protein L24 [Gammaproteobacteria bacterium]|tara:strand:- start:264 stop:581 length:318 start_codon:yes stop_codon:yes gene_type:complete